MLLFVGLGNPGSRYARNRHNIGFMTINEIARFWRATPWRNRFQGEIAEAQIGSEKILLLKPLTYMNESGISVSQVQRFFKIALSDIIVFYDELDLTPAKVRVKIGGGNAGHNGLRSISSHCGNDYKRVRIGIGRPKDKNAVIHYVLGDFSKADMEWVEDLTHACAHGADLLTTGQDATFQNKVHLSMEEQGWDMKRPSQEA